MSQSPSHTALPTVPSSAPEVTNSSAEQPRSAAPQRTTPPASLVRALANSIDSLLSGRIFSRAALTVENEENSLTAPPQTLAVEVLLEVFDQSPDALFIVSGLDGQIQFCNQTSANLAGEEREALVGRDFASLFPLSENGTATKLWQEPGRGQGTMLTLSVPYPVPMPRTLEFRSAPIQQDGESWIFLSGRDLGPQPTDSEDALREERDRLNAMVRSLRDGLVLLSKKGDILFTNPALEEMFGKENLPQVCHTWMKQFASYDQAGILGFSSPYEGQTLELPMNDGRTFLVTRSFLFQGRGAAAVMMIAKDISELKLLQEKGHQLEMELLRESKLAEFGALAAGIAHNLNGPLTSVLGSCDLIEMTQGTSPDVERIRGQALAMKEIIETLMRKSRQEQNPEPQEISINELIETEWKFLHANLFFKHDVEKRLELDETLPMIWAVYSDLSQAIGNLLRNAIDALQESEEKRLLVRTRQSGRFMFIDIEDTGIGIKSEDLPNLFKPFFTTKPMVGMGNADQPTGTGLGLATSRSLLARYGAEILVESTWQQGSTFTVRLPISPPDSTE
ncbi:MAG: PAS domain-containing protein [Calditrichaeota bacterium]|nr:PAS domain-containing protein [Calditrichota bacterium]